MKLISVAHAAGVIEDAPGFPELLMNILNFLLQAFGILAILALVISGILYITAFGNEERIKLAKKSATYSVIGVIVALGGMILVKTIGIFLK